ncbi:MAG: hydroxymethylglutaryl-CoA lyase [Pseudomonadota bacterium]|nr:hydroxymethylglutaryl-CoA lyase [Pseudomonadota bacterium]
MALSKIEICEVGPRDGLQSESRIWSVDERVELIDRLSATGVPRIEAVSFVNPKRVPQMADAETVMAKIQRREGVVFAGLALNAKGAERAIEAGCDEVRYVVVSSETFNQRNQGASIDETLAGFSQIADKVINAGLKLSATVAAAFGCPFEGKVEPKQVARIAKQLVDGGCVEIGIADSIGSGVPTQVDDLFASVREEVGVNIGIGFHLHNTRNTGFANAAAAANQGVLFLDSSVGGLGGCPFAPRATGNIATEDLCFMLRNMGFETGIDIDAYVEIASWAEGFFESPLPGQIMKAGLFPETVSV